MTKLLTIADTDPARSSQPVAYEIRSSALLLIDLDGDVVTTLQDRGSPASVITNMEQFDGSCARRVWAARLRYWAEQFEAEETRQLACAAPAGFVHRADWKPGDPRQVCGVYDYAGHDGPCEPRRPVG